MSAQLTLVPQRPLSEVSKDGPHQTDKDEHRSPRLACLPVDHEELSESLEDPREEVDNSSECFRCPRTSEVDIAGCVCNQKQVKILVD